MKKRHMIQCMMMLIALPLIWQCSGSPARSVYVKDGEAYGTVRGSFRHRWWNYYERGVSFSNGKFFKEAINDFEEAVNQRREDQRMARTYGMHFVDYFPHRELGIVYYETGNLERAREELERSIDSFPSAKAYFYLDRVRKTLIEQSQIKILAPRLTLNVESREIWTSQDPVIISGMAEDENYIERIFIKGVPYFQESAQKQLLFEKKLVLDQGEHIVKIQARNLPGRVTEEQVIIHVDREGPVISLKNFKFKATPLGNDVTISGWIHDATRVSTLVIDDKNIPIEKGSEVAFEATLDVRSDSVKIVTSDTLENKTHASIPLDSVPSAGFPVMVASNDHLARNLILAGIFGSKESRPPAITLKQFAENQLTFLEKAYIEGRVADENNIVKLTINREPVLKRSGSYVFFSHMVNLAEGLNVLEIEAEDEDGNQSLKKIEITRKIPKARQLSERLSIAALPFSQEGAISEKGLALQDRLTDEFINRHRFKMVERAELLAILQEQKIGRSSLIDRGTALKLGGLVAAQSIITGSITETRNGIEVVARLIDTETSDILSSQDVYGESKDLQSLSILADGMAIKFHHDFPVMEGVVVAKKGNAVFTDLGQSAVKLQRRLIIFRNMVDKETKDMNSTDSDQKILGYARVTQVMDQMSKAKLNDGRDGKINDMDRVITQ